MGTHPIFESDFDCLTEMEKRTVLPKVLTTYDEECLKLYSLCHYAGIMIDPSLFKNIVDLLKADVHPDAILKVLQDSSERSPYGVPDNQAKIERHVAKRQQREEEKNQTFSSSNERYPTENRPVRSTSHNRRSVSRSRRVQDNRFDSHAQ